MVRSLQDGPGDAGGDGLRIVIEPEHLGLSMSLAERRHDDIVITGHGATVFLSAGAAERLEGCTLRGGAVGAVPSFYLDRSLSARSRVSR